MPYEAQMRRLTLDQSLFTTIVEALNHQRNLVADGPWLLSVVDELAGQGATSCRYRLQVANESGHPGTFFIKQYTDLSSVGREQCQRDGRIARWLRQELGADTELKIAEPLLEMASKRILVSRYIEGENLSPYFFRKLRWHWLPAKSASDLAELAGRLGKGLMELQMIPAERVCRFFTETSPPTFFSVIRSQLQSFDTFYAEADVCAKLVRDVVGRVLVCLEDYRLSGPSYCFQHNDFILQNLIQGAGGRLHLFDFANSTVGIASFDMAQMLNSFEDLAYLKTVSTQQIDRLQQAFLAPFQQQKNFHGGLLAAMRAYSEFYSGTILLRRTGRFWRHPLRRALLTPPAQRLENRLLSLRDEIRF